jgi:hypothetical protein
MFRTIFICTLLLPLHAVAAESITPSVTFEGGYVNAVSVARAGKRLAIYGLRD